MITPLTGSPKTSRVFKFVDVGNVEDVEDELSFGDCKASFKQMKQKDTLGCLIQGGS